jgi:hypothetical protein
VLAKHFFGGEALLYVGERDDGAAAGAHLERHGDVRDREHRAVAPEEPVQVAADGLAGGEVLGRDADGAAQRPGRLLDPRLQAGGGEGRGGHQEESDEDGEGTFEAHAS